VFGRLIYRVPSYCLAILIYLLPFQISFADDLKTCSLPSANATIQQISDWAKVIDYIGKDTQLKKPSEDEYGSPLFGSIIGKSCFSGKWNQPIARSLFIDRFEKMLAYTMAQVGRCYQKIGFTELSNVIPILRRTRFECEKIEGGATMRNALVRPKPFVIPSLYSVNTNYDHEYKIIIDPEAFLEHSIETLAARLTHEALHSTAANNLADHNGAFKDKNAAGCTNSLFEDRIYFIEGACFPLSHNGHLFYLGLNVPKQPGDIPSQAGAPAMLCPDVCQKALTHVDDLNAFYKGGATKTTDLLSSVGPSLLAKPYSPSEVKIICAKLHDLVSQNLNFIFKPLNEEKNSILSRAKSRQNKLNETLSQKPGSPVMGRLLKKYSFANQLMTKYQTTAFRYQFASKLDRMKYLQRDLKYTIDKVCEKPLTKEWSVFCGQKPNLLIEDLQNNISFLERESEFREGLWTLPPWR